MTTRDAIIAGVFTQEVQAQRALDELSRAGFAYDQMGVATQSKKKVRLLDDLLSIGFSREQASYYDQEYKAGRTILSIDPEEREQEAKEILRRNGAYDHEQRAGSSTNQGATAVQSSMASGQMTEKQRDVTKPSSLSKQAGRTGQEDFYQPRSLKLREERLNVNKERVPTGEVDLRKEIITEQQTINVPVTHEEVVIEQHAVSGGQVDTAAIGEEETIRIPTSEERIDIKKNTVVTGEVSIGKRAIQENKQVTETTRREEARVEHEGDVTDTTIHRTDEPDPDQRGKRKG